MFVFPHGQAKYGVRRLLKDILHVRQRISLPPKAGPWRPDLLGWVSGEDVPAAPTPPAPACAGEDEGHIIVHLEASSPHDLEPVYHNLDARVRVQMAVYVGLVLEVLAPPSKQEPARVVNDACKEGGREEALPKNCR